MEKKIEKLKTEMSEIYGERLAFDHWEELEYSVIDEIGLKLNEIIDYLNSQEQELDKAREEGRLSVIQELLFEPEEPSHNIGTLEAAFKYEDIIKRYSGEWRNKTGLVSPKYIKSKLKDNK